MVEPIDVKSIISQVHELGKNQGVRRYAIPFTMADSLAIVDAIGKERNPKFVIDEENRFAYENIIKWLHGDETMQSIHPVTKQVISGDLKRGIYIAGNTGSGKTWCLDIMLEYLAMIKIPVLLGKDKYPTRLIWKTSRADEIVARFIESSSIDSYKQSRMLCIQDFGSEPLESVSMGNRMNVLRNLLEYRGDRNDCLTLITSNIPIAHAKMRSAYDDRVMSRLTEMCNYFEIKGKDRRKM